MHFGAVIIVLWSLCCSRYRVPQKPTVSLYVVPRS